MDSGLIIGIITALVTGLGFIVTGKVTKGGTKVTSQADVIASLQRQLDALSEKVDRMEEHDRIKEDYIDKLRDHINQGSPPPPPPWPTFPRGK